MANSPIGKAVTELDIQLEVIKSRLEEELIKTKSNAITARVGGTCDASVPAPEMQGF